MEERYRLKYKISTFYLYSQKIGLFGSYMNPAGCMQHTFVMYSLLQIWFDEEGYLLLSLGDGGAAGDPLGSGQDV